MVKNPATTYQNKTRYWHVGWAFILICLTRFFPLIFQGRTLFYGDNYYLLVPGKLFTVFWLKQGIIPLWNSLTLSGISWVGDISQSIFYPSTLLFWFFSPATALSLTVLLHTGLILLGTYLLAYRLSQHHQGSFLASILFAVSATVLGASNNLATLQSLTWLPWLIWASIDLTQTKKSVYLTGLFIFLLILGGYPQYLVLVILPSGVLSAVSLSQLKTQLSKLRLVWLYFYRWAITGLVGLGLSAFVLLPFSQTLLTSTRLTQSADQASMGSLRPLELLKLIIPHLFDAPALGIKWGPVWSGYPTALPYIGLTGLLIVAHYVMSKKSKTVWTQTLLLLTGLGGLLSLGSFIPGYVALLDKIPLFSTIRYPSMWLIMSHLTLVCLLAISWPKFKLSAPTAKIGLALAGTATVLSLACLSWSYWDGASLWHFIDTLTQLRLSHSVFHTLERDVLIFKMALTSATVVGASLGLALWAWWRQKLWWVVIVCVADAMFASQMTLLTAPRQIYPNQTQLQSVLISTLTTPEYRTLTRDMNSPYTDLGTYYQAYVVRQPFSDSFIDPAEIKQASFLQHLRDGLSPDWYLAAGIPVVHGYTTLLPQDYTQIWQNPTSENRINYLSYIPINSPQLAQWSVKYFLVDRAFAVKDDYSRLKKITSLDLWDVYELPGALPRIRTESGQAVSLTNYQETANAISFKIKLDQPTNLVIADRYEPGWRAQVNGQIIKLENYQGMRRLILPSGDSSVKLWYQPNALIYGLVITITTVLVIITSLWMNKSNLLT